MRRLFFLFFSFPLFLFSDGLQQDINQATAIIRQFQSIPESGIPGEILRNAKGLAIFKVLKGGFIFSGRVGRGIVIAKTPDGWSAPSAIGLGGVGYGLQIGGQITDFVIVLNTQAAVDAFSRGGNITLGGDVSIAAGPVGRSVEAGISVPLAAMYSYSRSKGLFAGVSLEGTVLVERGGVNESFYGRPVSARELLSGDVPQPKSAKGLYNQLNRFSKN